MEHKISLNEMPWLQGLINNGAEIGINTNLSAQETQSVWIDDDGMLNTSAIVTADIDVTPTLPDHLRKIIDNVTITTVVSEPNATDASAELKLNYENGDVHNEEIVHILEEISDGYNREHFSAATSGSDNVGFEIEDINVFCDFLKDIGKNGIKRNHDVSLDTPEP